MFSINCREEKHKREQERKSNNQRVKDDNLNRPFGLEWNVDDMVQHQKKMLEIIMKS